MIETLQQLGADHAWIVLPVGPLDLPLGGNVARLDFMLRDPIATALSRGFFASRPGETMLVAPGETPFAGLLLVGYGTQRQAWDAAMPVILDVLPQALPETADVVAVLPPYPVSGKLPLSWQKCAERYVPTVRSTMPRIRRWHWVDLMEGFA